MTDWFGRTGEEGLLYSCFWIFAREVRGDGEFVDMIKQDIDEGRLVLRPGAHQNVGLSQKEDGRHAVRDVSTLCAPDLCCTHRSGTGVHGICNGLEVIQWTTTAEGIDQEVRDWSQLKLLQPER